MMTSERSPLKSLQLPTCSPLLPRSSIKFTHLLVVPHVPVFRGEEEDDTEPDLDAIAASFADDQPDLPHAGSVHAESIVDQEVSRIQPNTQNVYLDCPGLGGSQLFSESAEHVLTAPKVGNRHQVYGPTLAPADKFMQSQV